MFLLYFILFLRITHTVCKHSVPCTFGFCMQFSVFCKIFQMPLQQMISNAIQKSHTSFNIKYSRTNLIIVPPYSVTLLIFLTILLLLLIVVKIILPVSASVLYICGEYDLSLGLAKSLKFSNKMIEICCCLETYLYEH